MRVSVILILWSDDKPIFRKQRNLFWKTKKHEVHGITSSHHTSVLIKEFYIRVSLFPYASRSLLMTLIFLIKGRKNFEVCCEQTLDRPILLLLKGKEYTENHMRLTI